MTRRPDPERIYEAHREGTFARLTRNERLGELEAENWITLWERQAEAEGRARDSLRYWSDGWDWIAAQRAGGRHPE